MKLGPYRDKPTEPKRPRFAYGVRMQTIGRMARDGLIVAAMILVPTLLLLLGRERPRLAQVLTGTLLLCGAAYGLVRAAMADARDL